MDMGWNGNAAPPMKPEPFGDGKPLWGNVGQNGQGKDPWANQQQPVGQKGKGQAPWGNQQQGYGAAPPAMNGMPPSDMNGAMMGQQGFGADKGQQKGQGYPPQQKGQGPQDSWDSWFQDAISPAEEQKPKKKKKGKRKHVLSSTQQRPGPGFGRHPWDEQEPWAENGGWEDQEKGKGPGRRFHRWDHWKKTHSGEVKVEFMCLK